MTTAGKGSTSVEARLRLIDAPHGHGVGQEAGSHLVATSVLP